MLASVNSSATMALQPEVPNLITELIAFSWAAQMPVKIKDKMQAARNNTATRE
jgi:hypothetical protein